MSHRQSLAKRRWHISQGDLALRQHTQGVCQDLPETLGSGHSQVFPLAPDFSCITTEYTPNRDLAVSNCINDDEPRLVVTLGMQGHSRFVEEGGYEVVFSAGYTTITTFHSSCGERQYEADKTVQQVRLVIGKRALERYFEADRLTPYFKTHLHTISHRPSSGQGWLAARQLLSCPVADSVQAVFRHGQALSLLAAELGAPTQDNRALTVAAQAKARVIVDSAYAILSRDMKKPPSVASLAQQVGTNTCTLKQAFRQCFDNTPYGVLFELRMHKAYELLADTGCQVGIAADAVGYRHASNFSAAFVDYFGVTPKAVSKSR